MDERFYTIAHPFMFQCASTLTMEVQLDELSESVPAYKLDPETVMLAMSNTLARDRMRATLSR